MLTYRRSHSLMFGLFAAVGAAATAGCAKQAGDARTHGPSDQAQTLGTSAGADRGGRVRPDLAAEGNAGAIAEHRRYAEDEAEAPAAPSLGTAYGEQLSSSVIETTFERRDPSQPFTAFAMHYDDPIGAFAPHRAWSPQVPTQSATVEAAGLEVTILDERGSPLMATTRPNGLLTAVGGVDQRYEIVVTNRTAQRFEVVVSVDGLDVIDGGDASYEHDGYVLDPWDSLEIEGWRTSYDQVAAFRFSDIPDSYGARTGRPQNVGVIGVAVFDEAPRQAPRPRPYSSPPWRPRSSTPEPFPGNR